MARRKNTNRTRTGTAQQNDDTLVDIVEVKEGAQSYLDENQSKIFGILTLLVLCIGGYMAYQTLYKEPKQKEAVEQMYQAQVQFEQDSFALALKNPGAGYGGFLDIIDNYGGTKAANLANYYSGISYLNLGEYDKAIEYLSSYSPSGDVTPIMKYGAIGDAYSEKNSMDEAMSYYQKAVNAGDNELVTAYYLQKVGLLKQKNGDQEGAKASFQQIKDKYPQSAIATEAEKFLSRIGG